MTPTPHPKGAIIDTGAVDWQIFQQDATGHADIALSGRWVLDKPGRVEVRLVHEDTGTTVSAPLDWHPADATNADGTWSATLRRVPAGGLYRLETRYRPSDQTQGEWSPSGDMRHFIGVGDLWVIAGQSNSAGYGRGPYSDVLELGIHMLRHSEQWALATHPMSDATDTRHPVNRENSNAGHSPYLHFARVLKEGLAHPIGLIPTALGGSPLSRWNPTEPGPSDLFENMVHGIKLAGGKVKGICWYQGESDTGDGDKAGTYGDRFVAAVEAWRDALADPNLPVLTVQLNRMTWDAGNATDLNWSLVREAQRQVPKRLKHVAVVPSLDCSLSDGIHTSPAGNMLLGERMARAALGMVYGQNVSYLAPDVQSAARNADGTQIRLSFAPVTSHIFTVHVQAKPFVIEDEAGVVPVKETKYPGDATVTVVLERALQGRAVVHGGHGTNPAIVPSDMERFIPMLAFYGMVVE